MICVPKHAANWQLSLAVNLRIPKATERSEREGGDAHQETAKNHPHK